MRSLIRTATVAVLVSAAIILAAFASGCGKGEAKAAGHVAQVTGEQEFAGRVLRADKPVLVDFFATWCVYCKKLAPTIGELAGEYEGRAGFVEVDVDRSPPLAKTYGVEGLPTVLVFGGGKVVKRLEGLREAGEYRAAIDSAIAAPSAGS